MISAISTSLGGLTAASNRLNVSANNIANQFSTGKKPYVPQQAVQSSQAGGGVSSSTAPVNPATQSVYDPSNPAADSSGVTQYLNVDPAQQLVQAKAASYDFKANLSALKVESSTYKSLLNIIS